MDLRNVVGWFYRSSGYLGEGTPGVLYGWKGRRSCAEAVSIRGMTRLFSGVETQPRGSVMKRSAATLIGCLFLAFVLPGTPASAQDDIEDPNTFEGVWYRIALDEEGEFVLGDGDGYAGGTWYHYPEPNGPGWWRQWYYNGPSDANRKGQLDYAVYIKAMDPSLQTSLEVRFNWATPEWSAQGKQRPPLPCDVPEAEMQARYMQDRLLHRVDHWFIGTVEPIKSHTVEEYNPEWVSIDVRGHNAYVYRGADHSSLPKDPFMGACYDQSTGDCYTGYEDQCEAPYVWLGWGTECSDYVTAGPFPVPVYRFWSPTFGKHIFTTSEREKDAFLAEPDETWAPEGIAFCALMDDTEPGCRPVHRFWSKQLGVYFYTILEPEKDNLVTNHSQVWSYEGPVFYAFAAGEEPEDTVPVYRFWSAELGYHLFTISEAEKDGLIENYPLFWAYEGVAWYAYAP